MDPLALKTLDETIQRTETEVKALRAKAEQFETDLHAWRRLRELWAREIEGTADEEPTLRQKILQIVLEWQGVIALGDIVAGLQDRFGIVSTVNTVSSAVSELAAKGAIRRLSRGRYAANGIPIDPRRILASTESPAEVATKDVAELVNGKPLEATPPEL